ncbi:MAG: competence protein ComEA [Fimbriimonadaceae bacterium]|nr:competence protein ComEA [Fimbriimonadaceae bacterium]
MSPRERIGYAGVAGLVLFGFGFVGARHLRKPAPIVFESAPVASTNATRAGQETPTEVVVHVAGAIKNPGVVRLPVGARVVDAVHAAGGPAANADLDSVNLAAKLIDASQLRILTKNETKTTSPSTAVSRHKTVVPEIDRGGYFAPVEIPPEYLAKAEIAPAPPSAKAQQIVSGPPAVTTEAPAASNRWAAAKPAPSEVAINAASLEELQKLPGVGPATAQKILAYREANGPFKSVEEILAIKGIGPKKFEKMRPYLKL